MAADVDLDELAVSMGGLSGAQLADAVNEAAIMAVREGALVMRRDHLREGYLRVLAGPKRRNAPIADGELEVIAAHEAGHVLCAEYGERYEKAQQVTVEPRGQAMGLAVYGQTDRAVHDADYLHEALVATLGGRAAEQAVFGRVSSGAANDLQKATELARRAVEQFGFSPRLGQIVAGNAPFAETTRSVIDAEIERMVADAYTDAVNLLREHRDQLDSLRERLLESRELERVDILAAIGSSSRSRGRTMRRSAEAAAPAAAGRGGRMILAADIGGTKTRLGLFDDSLCRRSRPPPRRPADLPEPQRPDRHVPQPRTTSRPSRACFGVAGPVVDGTGATGQPSLGRRLSRVPAGARH